MKKLLLATAAIFGLASAAPAVAVTIDFDDIVAAYGGTLVPANQYPDATFSSTDPSGVRALPYASYFGSSGTNYIGSSATNNMGNVQGTITVTFTSPVSGLSFYVLAASGPTNTFSLDLYQGSTMTTLTPALAYSNRKDLVDLSAYTGITQIVLRNSDPGGTPYDDFTFTVDAPSPGGDGVPEPSTAALLMLGLAGWGMSAVRRRRSGSGVAAAA